MTKGKVMEMVKPRKLSYTWNWGSDGTLVTFYLDANGEGTKLRLEHTGFIEGQDEQVFQGASMGWKEKLGYFESMRVHRQGHTEYWDNRDHGGFQFPGGMAPNLDLRYLYRFKSNLSWPAFSNWSEEDRHAVLVYLRHIPAIRHPTPEPVPGTGVATPGVLEQEHLWHDYGTAEAKPLK